MPRRLRAASVILATSTQSQHTATRELGIEPWKRVNLTTSHATNGKKYETKTQNPDCQKKDFKNNLKVEKIEKFPLRVGLFFECPPSSDK